MAARVRAWPRLAHSRPRLTCIELRPKLRLGGRVQPRGRAEAVGDARSRQGQSRGWRRRGLPLIRAAQEPAAPSLGKKRREVIVCGYSCLGCRGLSFHTFGYSERVYTCVRCVRVSRVRDCARELVEFFFLRGASLPLCELG